MAELFALVGLLALAVKCKGGRALIVGGWVRDKVLGALSKDIDVEVYGLNIEALHEVLSTFGGVDEVGRSFGILKLKGHDLDVSVPRRDNKLGVGHRAFSTTFDPGMLVEEAAGRRDFTMNSLAFDPISQEILDPFGGVQDLKEGRLRMTNPQQFGEDPLRILRAAQFLARFGLSPDQDLVEESRRLVSALSELPAERHFEEWRKLLLKGTKPSKGLRFLREIGALPPELQALVGLEQDPTWHPEGDVWEHTLLVVDEASKMESKSLALMFGALLHDVGKANTTVHDSDGHIRSHGHPETGEDFARSFLLRLKAPTKLIEQVVCLVRNHLAPHAFREASAKGFHRLARKLDSLELSMAELEAVARSDHFGRTTPDALARLFPDGEKFLARAQELHIEKKALPDVVRGRDLIARGLVPGPEFHRILDLARQIQDETGMTDPVGILDMIL
ncbi:MAG: HDIG domain-containing metalloprotein [Thermodesulfovibrionales bacterium]|jgi:tRNA nucleotidyltransferase (CCA-adding enzyme)